MPTQSRGHATQPQATWFAPFSMGQSLEGQSQRKSILRAGLWPFSKRAKWLTPVGTAV